MTMTVINDPILYLITARLIKWLLRLTVKNTHIVPSSVIQLWKNNHIVVKHNDIKYISNELVSTVTRERARQRVRN